MKTKYWILLIAGVLVACALLSVWFFAPGESARAVQVYSEGKLLYTLPLQVDTQITVTTSRGTNTVTVENGKVAVTQADCPDGHCMARGWCSSGAQIVCLPHRLVLNFTGTQPIDGSTG